MRWLAVLATLALIGCGDRPQPPAGLELGTPRAAHSATALTDGRVLVAGGCVTDGCGRATATTEVYADGRFSPGPRLAGPRDAHTATRLPGGQVLLAGGYPGEGHGPLATAEVCDATRCRPAGPMAQPRGDHAAALLPGGAVLMVGGTGAAAGTTEVWRDGRFHPGPPLLHPREAHTATALPGGRVLVAGGYAPDGRAVAEAELLGWAASRWTAAGRLRAARGKHATVRLADGRAIVIGGSRNSETRERLAATEIHDGRRFVPGPRLRTARYKIPDAAALLADGRVLVVGDGTPETLDPGRGISSAATGAAAGAFATATPLAGGGVLVTGGYDDRIAVSRSAYVAR